MFVVVAIYLCFFQQDRWLLSSEPYFFNAILYEKCILSWITCLIYIRVNFFFCKLHGVKAIQFAFDNVKLSVFIKTIRYFFENKCDICFFTLEFSILLTNYILHSIQKLSSHSYPKKLCSMGQICAFR